MKHDFTEWYNQRNMSKFVYPTDEQVADTADFGVRFEAEKSGEDIYSEDNESLFTRGNTSGMGETGTGIFLKTEVFDKRTGKTIFFIGPDIKKLGVGVKTVRYGLLHLIQKNIDEHQILCFLHPNNSVEIVGFFPADVLRAYLSDDDVIKKAACTKKVNPKSAFWRYDLGIPIATQEDVIELTKKYKLPPKPTFDFGF